MPFDGYWSAIDLRGDCTAVDGWALAAVTVRQDGPGRRYLGDDLDDRSPVRRGLVESGLGVGVRGGSLRDTVAELLVEHGDFRRGDRWNPLRPDRRGRLSVVLGGEEVWAMRLVSGGSSFTESFNKADSTTLGPDLTWTETVGDLEVFSNQLRSVTLATVSEARAEHDLASTDHYAEVQIVTLDAPVVGVNAVGPCARFSSSARTHYWARRRVTALGVHQILLLKVVAGVQTALGSAVAVAAPPQTARVECNGSTIRTLIDGVQQTTITDTSITTGTRAGVLFTVITAASTVVDNFAAADLSVSATVTPAAVAVPVSVPGPAVKAGASCAPVSHPVPVTVPTPTVPAGAAVTASPLGVPVTTPAPTVGAGATAVTAAHSVPVTVPTVTPEAAAAVTPAAVAVTVTLPTAGVGVGATVTTSAHLVAATFPTPAAAGATTATPVAVSVAATVPAPSIVAAATISPTVHLVPVTFPAPDFIGAEGAGNLAGAAATSGLTGHAETVGLGGSATVERLTGSVTT